MYLLFVRFCVRGLLPVIDPLHGVALEAVGPSCLVKLVEAGKKGEVRVYYYHSCNAACINEINKKPRCTAKT